ncbi:MAG: methyltransferase domain-containing protein [Sulfurimonas sp.]|nr:methyltransferase domain-containing protein [Sulfurimonas sp.]
MQDHFKEKSKEWDKGDVQVQGARIIADAINKKVELTIDMEILDFGVGTGLLGFDIARSVKKVYGVDTSLSMLEKLKAKNTPELSIETYCQDIITKPLDRTFNGLVSSMTLHHVEDLKTFFETIYRDINENGFIAIADLESEDGTFHSDNTGVFHFGFDKNELCKITTDAGFSDVVFENINTINKPHRDFGVFLLTAKK